ncbi:MAG: tRNA (guanosine(37)-N1)-methyltransferase TrmD [Acidiferrobacterales bacterium]|nr:tRNA (guanosine(37)-N1)-methyltransferase TrmD [Acidiferrobacterales bacterium]
MRIDIVTLFPEMFDAIIENGMSRVALEKGAMTLQCYNPRDETDDSYRRVDDRPYGGGPGMVMMPGPLTRCIDRVKQSNAGEVVYLSPQGEKLSHSLVSEFAGKADLILLCGRYEGIDQRVIETRVDREVSIGDFVVAGGELPAMLLIDAVSRLLPEVLGNASSAIEDSFSNGILDFPHYTRPEVFEGLEVPTVLLSGNHRKIEEWRHEQALSVTKRKRPDLLSDE